MTTFGAGLEHRRQQPRRAGCGGSRAGACAGTISGISTVIVASSSSTDLTYLSTVRTSERLGIEQHLDRDAAAPVVPVALDLARAPPRRRPPPRPTTVSPSDSAALTAFWVSRFTVEVGHDHDAVALVRRRRRLAELELAARPPRSSARCAVNSIISTGIAITTTQAPARNFVPRNTTTATAVITAPVPLSATRSRQCGGRSLTPVLDQPDLADREADEHPDRVQRDQVVGLGVDRDQQQRRRDRQREDPDPVDRLLGAQVEDVRQAVVLGQQAHQHRQAAEAGVRREPEHRGDREVGHVERPAGPERAGGQLGQDGDAAARHARGGRGSGRPARPASPRAARRARSRSAARSRTVGSRNAGTPLEIASTPVTAEQPAANALRISTIPSASVAWNVLRSCRSARPGAECNSADHDRREDADQEQRGRARSAAWPTR